MDGGVDLLLLETVFDTLNPKAALVVWRGLRGRSRVPADDLGDHSDRSGRTLSGQTLDAFYASIRHARPFSVGLNCALVRGRSGPTWRSLATGDGVRDLPSNAGLPNAFGEYDERQRRRRRCFATSPCPGS